MSREERRAYQRMQKKMDPYALPSNPAMRARQEKLAQRRARTAPGRAGQPAVGGLTRRFLGWTLGGGAVIALVAFSLAWDNGKGWPFALYVGVGAFAVWVALAFAARALASRAGPPPPRR